MLQLSIIKSILQKGFFKSIVNLDKIQDLQSVCISQKFKKIPCTYINLRFSLMCQSISLVFSNS